MLQAMGIYQKCLLLLIEK